MSDLIDRQAAIDALLAIQRELQMIDISEGADIAIHGVQLALHKIEKMPPAHLEVTQKDIELYCRQRCLTVITNGLFEKLKTRWSAQPERKTGRWIIHKSPDRYHANKIECSECGFEDVEDDEFNYCPKCGAKMEAEE